MAASAFSNISRRLRTTGSGQFSAFRQRARPLRTQAALALLAVTALLAGCATTHPIKPQHTAATTPAPPHPHGLWARMRDGFQLDHHTSQPAVRAWITFYSAHHRKLREDLLRAQPFLGRIVSEVRRRGLPAELALLPEVESAYKPFARSPVSGAAGLWQFMPATASRFGLRQDWWYDGRRDIFHSTAAALTYLRSLDQTFDQHWLLAVAAYNAGAGTVQWAMQNNARRGLPTDFWHLRLPAQTEQYVPQLLALAALVNHPPRYGITLPALPTPPALETVTVQGSIDLALAAQLAGLSPRRLRDLNPGFRRWASAPGRNAQLVLPRRCVPRFRRALAAVPPDKRVNWRHYVVRAGDTLKDIAAEYDLPVSVLARVNQVHGTRVHAGLALRIPQAQGGARLRVAMIAEHGPVLSRPQPVVIRYRVKPGDTLWSIAQRQNVAVATLRRWNRLPSHGVIKPGQRLIVHGRPARVADNRRAAAPPRPRLAAQRYTVERGQDLWSIARRFGVSVKAIRDRNALADGAPIKPGQVLSIPRVGGRLFYNVRKGDSLTRIAQRYSVSVADIRRWNGLPKGRFLRPGQRLEIITRGDRARDSS